MPTSAFNTRLFDTMAGNVVTVPPPIAGNGETLESFRSMRALRVGLFFCLRTVSSLLTEQSSTILKSSDNFDTGDS